MDNGSMEPAEIDVDGAEGVTITWEDGQTSHYDAEALRTSCPCASCRDIRDRGMAVVATGVVPVAAELVGNWGLQITWSDGHSTGIYSWEFLQALNGT